MADASQVPPLEGGTGVCVIMAGGRGTRFWPLSRKDRPKQLLPLSGGGSLLRETYERLAPLVGDRRILVITSGNLTEATREQLPELPPENVITEPQGRNTAPCAALGLGLAGRIAPEAPVALLPADHYIPDAEAFRVQLAEAFAIARSKPTVITLGIAPTRPETGYGYIQTDDRNAPDGSLAGTAFVEKPDRSTAETYLASGRYFWNAGIFIWNPGHFTAMAEQYIPEIMQRMTAPVAAHGTEQFAAALAEAYADCPADSIDFAVMEKLPGFEVLPAAFAWSDLGSWDAWGELAPELADGNHGRTDLLAIGSRQNVVLAEDKTVALIGVDDLIVVDTPDALLVCRKDDAQKIKEIITRLEDQKRSDLL